MLVKVIHKRSLWISKSDPFGNVYRWPCREPSSKYGNVDMVRQFRREIEIHSRMNHPNILKMFGYFFDDQNIYMILEWATEGELFAMLKSSKD